jgi:uncharacterized protein
MDIPFELHSVVIAALVVAAAFIIFGISAFGAALITVPVLSHFFPLDFVLPTCALLDVTAAMTLGVRVSRGADMSELKLMVPSCLLGAVLGVTLLVSLPRQATLIAFGAFLVAYSAYALRHGGAMRKVSRAWGLVAGFAGGVLGTIFGVGAPPYAMYLPRRIDDKLVLRATLSTMVVFSTATRAVVFAAGGLMLGDRLIMFAILLPFALAGLAFGHRLQGRISRDQLARFMSILVLLIGVSVLVRALAM